jgi:hypothetical protein
VLNDCVLWSCLRVRVFATLRALLLPLLLSVLTIAMAMVHRADATETQLGGANTVPIRFDLPVQPLAAALVTFSELTGYSVLVSSSLTTGRQAAAVHGEFEPRDALQRLLADSGLLIRYVGARAFTLLPALTAASTVSTRDGGVSGRASDDAKNELDRENYAAGLQLSITRLLCAVQPEAFGRYRIGFQLWFGDDGKVRDARLLESSGVRKRDVAVLSALRGLVIDGLPRDLPQPVTILLTPRSDSLVDCRSSR